MYIYGFNSFSSTVHIAAAYPKTAGLLAALALSGFLFWHSQGVRKPAVRPNTQAVESLK